MSEVIKSQVDIITEPVAANRPLALTTFDVTDSIVVDEKALLEAEKIGLNMAIEYHSFEMGVEVRGLFLGCMPYACTNTQTGEEQVLTGAIWVNEKGQGKINCAAKFVSAIGTLPSKTPFSATFIKTKKTSSGGNMQMFDIRRVNYEAA